MKLLSSGQSSYERFNSWTILAFLTFILCIVFIVYPFSVLLIKSVVHENGVASLDNYAAFFKSKYYLSTLFNSFKVSFSATILASLIGIPMAYFTSRYRIFGKKLVDNMCVMAMLSPPFIGAYAWIVLLGRAGFITGAFKHLGIVLPSIYGFKGILLVFTLKLFPYVYLYVSGALSTMDASLEEAAENLGVSGLRKLCTITFPLILPTILSSALMVFMTSLADFGTPAIIGEGFKVLPVCIYDEYMSELGAGNTDFANVLSIVIIVLAMMVLVLQKKAISGRSYNMSNLRPPKVNELPFIKKLVLSIGIYFVAFLGILSQITVAFTSFIKTSGPVFLPGFGLGSYEEAFDKMSTAIVNSFTFSLAAIVIMVVFSLLISYLIVRRSSRFTNIIDMLIMFPYVIPGSVLGVMLVAAFNKPPLILAGTPAILILSYVIRKIPFTLRSSVGILYQLESSVEEASISLGVSPMKTFFKITARLMLPGVISGAILSWIATINELSSTLILYSGGTETISVAIYNEVTSKAHFGTAAALATILTLATIIPLWICKSVTGEKISI